MAPHNQSVVIYPVGLGDAWGHRPVQSSQREKELGSHLLQVMCDPFMIHI